MQHLKFKSVARNILRDGESLRLIDDLLVVRCQSVIDPALHEDFHPPHVVGVHLVAVAEIGKLEPSTSAFFWKAMSSGSL